MSGWEHALVERSDSWSADGSEEQGLWVETPEGRQQLSQEDASPSNVRSVLDALGHRGWELISTESATMSGHIQTVYWLRRPLAD